MYQEKDRKAPSAYERLESKYPALLRPNHLAAESGIHPVRIREMLKSGEIEGMKIGSRWFIPIAAAAAFLDGGTNHDAA